MFTNCSSLVSIKIPSSMKEIGIFAFSWCTKLNKLTIEEGVEKIFWQAFYNCVSLKTVTIPSSVTYIGEEVFAFCTSLSNIIYEGITKPSYGPNVFSYCPSTLTFSFPNCYKDTDFCGYSVTPVSCT